MYRPLASAVKVRTTTFSSRLLIVTLAPATAAPDESVTVPEIDPVTSCAQAAPQNPAPSPTTNNKTNSLRITPPLNLTDDFKLPGQTVYDLAAVPPVRRLHKLDRFPIV